MTAQHGQRYGRNGVLGLAGRIPIAALVALVLFAGTPAHGAFTEPRLALVRASAYRSTSGSTTLTLEGSFSFADAVQLGLPLNVVVTQGERSARFDLAGSVFTRTNGAPEQPVAGLGVVSITQREIVLVLPATFSAGAATAQVIATYDGKAIASNQLGFSL